MSEILTRAAWLSLLARNPKWLSWKRFFCNRNSTAILDMEAKRKLDQELFDAVEQNNLDNVKRCFCKSSILAKNNDDKSPLDVALDKRYLNIVEYILDVSIEYLNDGSYDEAMKIYQAVLNNLKDGDIYIVASICMGEALERQEKYEKANKFFQDGYNKCKVECKPNAYIAYIGQKLAHNFRCLDRKIEALLIENEVYDIRRNEMGFHHKDTSAPFLCMPLDLLELGNSNEALKQNLNKDVQGIFDAVEQNDLGNVKKCFNNGCGILIRNNDGKTPLDVALEKGYLDIVEWYTFDVGKEYEDNGNFDEVMKIYNTVVNSLKDGSVYLYAYFHLGIALCELGRHEDAMKVLQYAYDERKVLFGLHHRKTAEAGRSLAVAYRRLGKNKEALEYDKLAYKVGKKLLGEDHWFTLDIQHNIAVDLNSLGETEEALKIYEEVLRLRKKVLGPDHRETKRTEYNISDIHNSNRKNNFDYTEEHSLDKDFQEILDAIMQNNADMVQNFFYNGSGFLIRNKDGETALDVALDKEYFKIVGWYVYKVGEEYLNDGRYDEATQIFQAVLGKLKDGEIHLHAHFYLALTLERQERYEEAIKAFQDTYKESKAFYGSNDLKYAEIGHCLANCFRNQNKYREALEIDREVLYTRTKTLGCDHPLTLISQHNFAMDNAFLGNCGDVLFFFLNEVHRIREKVLGSDYLDTMSLQTAAEKIRNLFEMCNDGKKNLSSAMPTGRATGFSNKKRKNWSLPSTASCIKIPFL